jgi:hypothetical protein
VYVPVDRPQHMLMFKPAHVLVLCILIRCTVWCGKLLAV